MPLILASQSDESRSFLKWCTDNINVAPSVPINFQQHKALQQIYSDTSTEQVWLKGAQVGCTFTGISKAFYITEELKRDCIYYLPDQDFARLFLKTRVNPIREYSPYLMQVFRATQYQGLLETESGTFCYFKGLKAKTSALSVPSHVNIYDEVDVLPRDNLLWSEDRLDASEMAWKIYLSVGMIPGAGIDAKYNASDQHVWIVRCSGCRKEHILEEEFPECFHEFSDGSVIVVCKHCGKELDRQAGIWIPKKPEVEVRGYRIPQLIIGKISPKKIWKKYMEVRDKPSEFAMFKCSKLALPDAGNRQPVTDLILQLCRNPVGGLSFLFDSAKWSYAGIDIGDMCHFVLIDVLSDGKERVIWIESCPSEQLLERYKHLAKQFHILCGCGDAMPYKTEMKKIAAVFPEDFYLRYYSADPEIRMAEEITPEDRSIKTVHVDRNLALDETTDALSTGNIILPTARVGEREKMLEFDQHLKMLVKKERIDARGNKKQEYRKDVDNHYGMALTNARIAARISRFGDSAPTVAPVFVDVFTS